MTMHYVFSKYTVTSPKLLLSIKLHDFAKHAWLSE